MNLRPNEPLPFSDMTAVSNGSTMLIAKTLLYFALYLQQLPPHFDARLLQVHDIEEAVQKYVQSVKSLVLSQDNLLCSLDGHECLHLLGMIHINDAEVRRAWLAFRRAHDVARLCGLGDSFSTSSRQDHSGEMILRRRLWLSTISGDCYCSLLLGLEPGFGMAPFGPDDEISHDPSVDDDTRFQRELCPILARLAQRNVAGIQRDRNIAKEIDQALNILKASMPTSWWRCPSLNQPCLSDTARDYNRLMCQLWFFQVRVMTHLPIAFEKADGNPGHSVTACLEGSRIILQRWLGLQRTGNHLPRSRTLDLCAFLAAIVVMLTRIQRGYQRRDWLDCQDDSDNTLIEQVIHLFETTGRDCKREHIARQSAEILSSIMTVTVANFDNIFLTTSKFESAKLTPDDELSGTELEVDRVETEDAGIEDVLASSIQQALGKRTAASRLVSLLLMDKKNQGSNSARKVSNVEFGLNDLLEGDLLG